MVRQIDDKSLAEKVKLLKQKTGALTDSDIHLILTHRARVIKKIQSDSTLLASAYKYYGPKYYENENGEKFLDVEASTKACIAFIQDWGLIYNPQRTTLKTLPVVLFPKQKDYVRWILALYSTKVNGCVDKCRDVGATWVAVFVACWLYLFVDGVTIGFCTFKAEECDKMGNLSTLIPKARLFLDNIPNFFTGKLDKDWATKQYQITNYRNNSSIVGLYGRNPGRSGRTTMVFKDESAFYENADEVEASLNANTGISVDISTPNGTETLFYRKKRGILHQIEKEGVKGLVPLFTFDWQDNPNHTQEWFDKKKQQAEYEGTMHLFKREILRDETSSLSDRVINSAHIRAAIDSHIILAEKFPLTGRRAGFDLANSEVDGDRNAFSIAQGNRVDFCSEWPGIDALKASQKAWSFCGKERIGTLIFDAIGVGATASTYFREKEENQTIAVQGTKLLTTKMPDDYVATEFVPFVSNMICYRPDMYEYSQDVTNSTLFRDAKAMSWWHVRLMFEHTYRAVNGLTYDPNMLISINYSDADSTQRIIFDKLIEELGQPTFTLDKKIVIDKKPKSARSPNLADSFIMMFAPIDTAFSLSVLI